MKNVYFLCYSRYVIFVAYILKKTLHQEDKVTLIISDEIANEENISEHIRNTGLWDDVISFPEKGVTPSIIENSVKEFINSHKIDCFYVAHIMRCASHYFIKYLEGDTEINMFDEGVITLDWMSCYSWYTEKGLPQGWVDFDFDRVDNIYSFFAPIVKPFGRASVKQIELEGILNEQFIDELNYMFNYEYEQENIDVLFIDTTGGTVGIYTEEYEQYCIDSVLQYVKTDDCYIKIKPSERKETLEKKYGKHKVKYISGGMVPFEVIYLNMLRFNCFPKVMITVDCSLIWNVLRINQMNNIKIDMILLFKLMSEYYIDKFWQDDSMRTMKCYMSCLNCEDLFLPESWDELYAYFKQNPKLFTVPEQDEWKECELRWLRSRYMDLIRQDKYIAKPRFLTLSKWLDLVYQGKSIETYFRQKNIRKIMMYGIGYYGKLFIEAIKGTELEVEMIVVTNVSDSQFRVEGIPICSVASLIERKEQYTCPILITAVGKESAIIESLEKNGIKNEIIVFGDIVEVSEKS